MRQILLYTLVFFYSIVASPLYGQKQNDQVLIYGFIKNFSNIIEIVDKSEIEPLQLTNSDRSFVPESGGRFSIQFTLDRPKYFRIARNNLYLSPGDSLEVVIDYNYATKSSFKGRHSAENEYLKFIPYPKAGSFLEAGTKVKATIGLTVKEVLELAHKRIETLNLYKNFSAGFKFFEENRITADILNSLYSLYRYYPLAHKLKGDSLAAFEKNFLYTIEPFVRKYKSITMDARLLSLEVYRDLLPALLNLADTTKNMSQVNDWLLAKKMVHEMQTDNETIDTSAFKREFNQIKTPEYRNAVLATYRKLLSLNGNNATDLLLTDTKRNFLRLSSFRGKIIYIDVWATWCVPCIQEQPYLDSLKERYKHNSNVIFLSLSIDSKTSNWIKFITKTNLSGFQFNVDISKLESYYVSEIPRTIIIDKNFKIYAMRGPMPSNKESIDMLQKMLKE